MNPCRKEDQSANENHPRHTVGPRRQTINYFKLNYTIACSAIAILLTANAAQAVPVVGLYQDDPAHCDNHGALTLTHELGDLTVFPANEAIDTTATLSTDPAHFTCEPDDGVPNEYRVRMVNLTPVDWVDVFFVADAGVLVGNYDGGVADASSSPPVYVEAFRIDDVGLNQPLVSESVIPNGVFESGEIWEFLVTNFTANGPPQFGSVGVFAQTSALGIDTVSNASILARPVPEPTAAGIVLAAVLALCPRRWRSRHRGA